MAETLLSLLMADTDNHHMVQSNVGHRMAETPLDRTVGTPIDKVLPLEGEAPEQVPEHRR